MENYFQHVKLLNSLLLRLGLIVEPINFTINRLFIYDNGNCTLEMVVDF